MENHTHEPTYTGAYSIINNLGVAALNTMAWIFTANGLQTFGSLCLTFLSISFVGFQFFLKIVEYKEVRQKKQIEKELKNKPKSE